MNPLPGILIFFLTGLFIAGIGVWMSGDDRRSVSLKMAAFQEDGIIFLAHFALGTIVYSLVWMHLNDPADGFYVVAIAGATTAFLRWLQNQRLVQALANFSATLGGCLPVYGVIHAAVMP